jgi:two-component system sensor histidine kinase KdpD
MVARHAAKRAARILLVFSAVALVTLFYRVTAFANATTVALTFLLLVLAAATLWGLAEAIAASVFATLCFNYYFLHPVGTWTIANAQDWLALFVFLIVSVVGSQLSERTRRMAQESARAMEIAAQAELVRQKEEFKSTLLDALAHDLKTPLTSVKASASALLEDAASLSSSQRELVSIVAEESERLNRLVTEVLEMARTEAGKLRLNRQACSVENLVRGALLESKRALEGRRIEVQMAPDVPPVSADAELIQTVLRSLLDNAAKYSPAGEAIAIQAEQDDRFVRICVTDRGPGLSEEDLPQVFERYFRGAATQATVRGMGIGLAVARDIVRAHGGKIWAEGSPGQGSRFSFTLPLAS